MRTKLTAVLSVGVVMLMARSAAAQQPPAEGQPPAPAAATPAPPAGAEPGAPPAAAAPAPGAAAPAAPAGEEEEKARFRWGISGFGGKYFVAGTGGGIGGIDVRLGAQINNMIGVYGQPILMIGAGVSSSATGGSASALALVGASGMVDFTFSDLVFVGVGPELLTGGAGYSSAGTGGASAGAESGTFFSVAARAGLALGSMKPTRRKAFTIGLDLHAIFTSDVTVVPLLALGYDSF
jgi:hypothetical protein